MMVSELHWRDLAKFAEVLLRPSQFDHEIYALLKQGYPQAVAVDILCGMVGHHVLEAAGLAAALASPAHNALSELEQLGLYLQTLHIPEIVQGPGFSKTALYARFLGDIKPAIQRLSHVMPAVLAEYVSESYPTVQDPNELLKRADQLAEIEPDQAKVLAARAGAMVLRGKRLWWGWAEQIHPSIRPWVLSTVAFVNSLTQNGERSLGTPASARQQWRKEIGYLQRIIQEVGDGRTYLAEIQFSQTQARDTEITEMIYALFDGEDALGEPLLAAYARRRAEAIPHLVALTQDRQLWASDATGGGWTPIHAVNLLGYLEAPEAAETLVRLVAATDAEDYLHDCALQALESIGRPALPHLLDAMAYSQDNRLKLALAPVLGTLGRGNPLAVQALGALYRELPAHLDIGPVIIGLSALQDYQVLPLLQHALSDPRLSWIDRMEIEAALADLAAPALQAAPLA